MQKAVNPVNTYKHAEAIYMKKINENTKVTLTLAQIKKLVKEAGRFKDMTKSLDDPAFTDTQDEYNVRKLRQQMLKDMEIIEKNEDLPEAIQLVEKMDEIVHKRKIDAPMSRKFIDWKGTTPGFGTLVDCYGISTSEGYEIWYNPNDPNDTGWGFNEFEDGPLHDATADGFVNAVMGGELTPEDQKQIADAIHKMASELDTFLGKVEEYYKEFVARPGVKVSEGKFKDMKDNLLGEGDEVAANADVDYDDEDGQEPGIPQVVEPAIDERLCEMIAEIANDYFDMDVDDYETRAIADEQLDSIYTSMRSLALKWLKAVKDSK